MTLYAFLKSILLVLILMYCAPFFITHSRSYYSTLLEPHTAVALVTLPRTLTTSSQSLAELTFLFKKPSIKAIVLTIDCNTSAAGTSQLMFHEIQSLKKDYPKPLIGLIENECLSGAYLIASTCDMLIAPETALIGNIGYYATPEQTTTNETLRTEIYQITTRHIATARKLSLATVHNWAHEHTMTGKQALKLGLIDAIGSLYTIENILKEKIASDDTITWATYNDHYTIPPVSISLFATRAQ